MLRIFGKFLAVSALIAGCASAPKTQTARSALEIDADHTKQAMLSKDPALHSLLDQAAGYIVFPEVKQGGFIVGGAGGKGVVYEKGQPAGYAEMNQASVGAQLGGQKYAEMVVVRDKFTFDKIKSGSFDVGGQASAVILKQGAGSATGFGDNGVAVIVDPLKGAMVNVSLTGQRIKTTL